MDQPHETVGLGAPEPGRRTLGLDPACALYGSARRARRLLTSGLGAGGLRLPAADELNRWSWLGIVR